MTIKNESKNERWCTTLFAFWYDTFAATIEAALARTCIRLVIALEFQSFASNACA